MNTNTTSDAMVLRFQRGVRDDQSPIESFLCYRTVEGVREPRTTTNVLYAFRFAKAEDIDAALATEAVQTLLAKINRSGPGITRIEVMTLQVTYTLLEHA